MASLKIDYYNFAVRERLPKNHWMLIIIIVNINNAFTSDLKKE